MRICFYRPETASLVSGVPVCALGGAELRSWEFARRLAAVPAFQVDFVVGDFGQPAVLQRDGVAIRVHAEPYRRRICVAYRRYCDALKQLRSGRISAPTSALVKSLPWLVVDRLARLIWSCDVKYRFDRMLADVKPDAVVCFGATPESADLVFACREAGIPSVVCITEDGPLKGKYGGGPAIRRADREAVRRVNESLATATEIVVQTQRQQELLANHSGRKGRVIRNPLLATAGAVPVASPAVLWVGRAELVHKRPDRLWELARMCPDTPFRVILNPDHAGVWESLMSIKPANIEVIARVPPDQIAGHFASAAMLANTSASEGFPNAFLQAASLGVPVVSLDVDPDGFLSRHGCGVSCGGDLKTMAAEIARLWGDVEARSAMGQRGQAYVGRFHDPDRCLNEFIQLLGSLQQRSEKAG